MRSTEAIFVAFFLLAIFPVATNCWAQLTIQGPQTVYNGQNVSAVDLIANPHRNVEPLRALVTQKAGKPYSQTDVENSIAALQRTGQFPKVQVSVVPEISGLRLDFLLEPAYYIGIIHFPGAARKFTYSRLLQVVDLPDEDPYDKQRLPAAEESLRRFLFHNGYFLATVQTTSQIDDQHELVDVTFLVNLGPRARVGTVTIKSGDPRENTRLAHAVRSLRARFTGGLLKHGKPYTPERITAATRLMHKTLSGQNYLASKVHELPPHYQSETNRVDLSFQVEKGPTVIVKTTGARLTWIPLLAGRERTKLIPIYSEGTIDRDLVQEGQQNLIDYFQGKGYFDAKVATKFQRALNQDTLVYQIAKGRKHKVARISFRRNHAMSGDDLMTEVVVKKAKLWSHGAVSQKLVAQSIKNLSSFYADHGYQDAKVTAQTVDCEPKIDVDFEIAEGQQTTVQSVDVTGNNSVAADKLTMPRGFQVRPGQPFSPRLMTDDRNRISANYLNRGFLNAEVKANVTRVANDPYRVNVIYAVTEHQNVRIGDVVYLGQRHTRLSLIRKTSRLTTESPMRRGSLMAAESLLYDLQVFDWASVDPRKPITSQAEESVLVKVHEAPRTDIIYGFGFEIAHRGGNIPTGTVAVPGLPPVQIGKYQIAPSQALFASPQGSIEVNRRNMRGLGETASVSLLLSRLDQRFLSSYSQPYFFGSTWSSLTSFSLERNTENPLFAATLGDASLQVERLLSRKTDTRLQFRYDFNKTYLAHLLVPQLVLSRDRNVRLSTLSSTFIRDTRDKPLDAHRGTFTTVNLSLTPTAFGSSANLAKLFGQYAFYKPVHSIVLADSIRLGLASAFANSFVPTSQLFFSGGGTSLRGFPIDEAGPQRLVPFCNVFTGQSGCVKISVPVGGRQLFILNSEVRFPLGIMKALGGVVFYDGGNVYSAINFNNFVNNYTNTIGVGLRYATPIGPIRFDIGKNLNPVTGIGSVQYYITLGQAF